MHLEMNVNNINKILHLKGFDDKEVLEVVKSGYRLWAPVVDIKYQNEYNDYTTILVYDHEMNMIGNGVLIV